MRGVDPAAEEILGMAPAKKSRGGWVSEGM